MITDLQLRRIFLIICTILSTIIGLNGSIYYIVVLAVVFIGLISIHVYKERLDDDYPVNKDKKLLIPAVIVYTIFLLNGVLYGLNIYSKFGIDSENVKLLIKAILLVFLIFGLRIFGSSIKKINWKIKRNQFLYTLGFIILFSPILIYLRGLAFLNLKPELLLYNVLCIIFLDGIFEELVNRGLFISGLMGYGFTEEKANIIQSLVFGVLHCFAYLSNGIIIAILLTVLQTLLGYLFGKIYLTTKSLMPGILIHIVWNILTM